MKSKIKETKNFSYIDKDMSDASKNGENIGKKEIMEILWKDKLKFDESKIDRGIVEHLKKINHLGYKTIMSCSGMEKDHDEKNNDRCPYICFDKPQFTEKDELNVFIRFLGDSLYNSNWFVEIFYPYVVGYLPKKLSDEVIKVRFQKLVNTLKLRDFFKYSY